MAHQEPEDIGALRYRGDTRAADLDPNDFVIVPHVAVLDEFDMTDDSGEVIARIDKYYIAKVVARMNERETTTGDLTPGVIGHTKDNPQGEDELRGPPVVLWARNWVQDPFFDTGKTAAFADFWVYKDQVELVRKFKRRSAEVWVNKHEIDPISLLGATTPARDLGLLKLSRKSNDQSLDLSSPVVGGLFERTVRLNRNPTNRESPAMPEEKRTDKPAGDTKETGSYKELLGVMQQILAGQSALIEKIGSMGAPAPAESPTVDTGAKDGAPSDDELEKLLAQYDQGQDAKPNEDEDDEDDEDDKSRKGETVVKNEAGYPGGTDTHVPNLQGKAKMSRDAQHAQLAEEVTILKAKLARTEVREQLTEARDRFRADLDPSDETLITELVILPPDTRKSMIARLSRNKSKTAPNGHAAGANKSATDGVKRISSPEDTQKVVKLARDKKISYDQAKAELGFE